MALSVDALINGRNITGLYVGIKTRVEKVYNNGIGTWKTYIYVNGYANADARAQGLSDFQNHIIIADGEMDIPMSYAHLKTQKIDLYGIDFSTAVDV